MKENQMTKQVAKKNLAPIIFPEGAPKVHITVASEGEGKNKSFQFPYIQNYILLQHVFCKSWWLSRLAVWSWTFSVFQFLSL